MRKILIVLAISFTAILSLNYILGVVQTPPGYMFLGTVHYPSDYLYYLSLFTQGKDHWFRTLDLFTSETIQPSLVWFTNVLAGHLLSFINIPPILAYQLTLTLYTFLFFLLVIFLLEKVFPKEKQAQCIAFILLGITNVMPGLGSFFANFTEPMTRFPRVPHHMLALVCTLLPMLIVLKWQKTHALPVNVIMGVVTAGSSILLSNISPIQWILVCATLLFSATVDGITRKRPVAGRHSFFIVPLTFLISGLPMIWYVFYIFKTLPFSLMAQWDFAVQIRLSVSDFLRSFGPVFVLAILGLPLFCKRLTTARIIILVYTVASIALFVSPVSRYIGLSNFRFVSAVTILGESILAANFLIHVPIASRLVRRVFIWSVVGVLCIFFIPQFIRQFQQHAYLDAANSYVYLSLDAVSAYREAQKITHEGDIVLATWPFDGSFPALTGRRGYMGHPLLTIHSEKKIHDAFLFFDAQIDSNAMYRFLTDNHITYVLSFTSVTKIARPFLQVVYQNSLLTLYKVMPY